MAGYSTLYPSHCPPRAVLPLPAAQPKRPPYSLTNLTFRTNTTPSLHLHLTSGIASGSFGEVYRALDVTPSPSSHHAAAGGFGLDFGFSGTGTLQRGTSEYAVKCIPKPREGSEEERMLFREMGNHARVSRFAKILSVLHVCVVSTGSATTTSTSRSPARFVETPSGDLIEEESHPHPPQEAQERGEPSQWVCIIMDYIQSGDLASLIFHSRFFHHKSKSNSFLIKKVFLDILSAVEYCHSHDVFHRDLKPENVLVYREGGSGARDDVEIRLGDFGLSTQERESWEFGCGTGAYMSPECFNANNTDTPYSTPSTDVWSLGLILWNLIGSEHPWDRPCPRTSAFYAAFARDPWDKKVMIPGVTDEAWDVIVRALHVDPRRRSTLREMRGRILGVRDVYVRTSEGRRGEEGVQPHAGHVRMDVQSRSPSPRYSDDVRRQDECERLGLPLDADPYRCRRDSAIGAFGRERGEYQKQVYAHRQPESSYHRPGIDFRRVDEQHYAFPRMHVDSGYGSGSGSRESRFHQLQQHQGSFSFRRHDTRRKERACWDRNDVTSFLDRRRRDREVRHRGADSSREWSTAGEPEPEPETQRQWSRRERIRKIAERGGRRPRSPFKW